MLENNKKARDENYTASILQSHLKDLHAAAHADRLDEAGVADARLPPAPRVGTRTRGMLGVLGGSELRGIISFDRACRRAGSQQSKEPMWRAR